MQNAVSVTMEKFSVNNGNPFNSMTMQASYDLPKPQKCIQGAPLLELDAEDSHSSDYTVLKTHLLSNTSEI